MDDTVLYQKFKVIRMPREGKACIADPDLHSWTMFETTEIKRVTMNDAREDITRRVYSLISAINKAIEVVDKYEYPYGEYYLDVLNTILAALIRFNHHLSTIDPTDDVFAESWNKLSDELDYFNSEMSSNMDPEEDDTYVEIRRIMSKCRVKSKLLLQSIIRLEIVASQDLTPIKDYIQSQISMFDTLYMMVDHTYLDRCWKTMTK